MKRHTDTNNSTDELKGKPEAPSSSGLPNPKKPKKVQEHLCDRPRSDFQFHRRHGLGITLSNNMQTAHRRDEFYNGLVMSSAPMEKEVIYEVQVEEIDFSQDKTLLYVGVLTESPDNMNLPVSCRRLNSALVVSSFEVIIAHACDRVQEDTRVASKLENVKVGSRVGLLVDTEVFLHVVVDGEDLGRVTPDTRLPINKDLYALYDMGWRLKRISVSLDPSFRQVSMAIAAPLEQQEQIQGEFQFHDNHGANIELTNDKTTAKRTSDHSNGIVMSSVAMERNVLYRVRVDTIDHTRDGLSTYLGVVTRRPDVIPALPSRSSDLTCAVVLSPGVIFVNKHQRYPDTEIETTSLLHVREGSQIGVLVTDEDYLHVMVNGRDLGRIRRLPHGSPVYAMFDLSYRLKKVTALPLTRVSQSLIL